VRIAIVNDVAMAVEAITRVLAGAPEHQLAWVARDGAEAVTRCASDTPDLILMDLLMPELNGVEATRRIMAATPCAILIVTASVEGHAGKVFGALGAGALDVVATPILGPDGSAGGGAALLAKIDVIGRLIGAEPARRAKPERAEPPSGPAREGRLVVIGASAGGPAALATILGDLPRDFPAAIVVVQHVDALFAPQMASWLNEQSVLPVRTATEGDSPQPGTILMASTNDHLTFLNSRQLGYTPEPRSHSYRPSVDVFFHSAIEHWPGEVVAVLLTGMGRDGAKGLKALRGAGVLTIAQDRATCVVYGMPKAAAELGAAAEILPLERIAPRLKEIFARSKIGGVERV
jgi:two-component system response regulator WspF